MMQKTACKERFLTSGLFYSLDGLSEFLFLYLESFPPDTINPISDIVAPAATVLL